MNTTDISASLDSYDLGRLMTQTRKLAADYRQQTGQALPVTEELARFDAISILGLAKLEGEEGVDAVDRIAQAANLSDMVINRYLIKGRVIFKGGKARQKLGKLNLSVGWTVLLMVIYDADYLPKQVYRINRDIIDFAMENMAQDKRGSMTVAKYKAIGELIWENSELEADANLKTMKNTSERDPKD